MSFASLAEELRAGPSSGSLESLPYAAYLGLHYAVHGRELVITMPYAEHLVGQPYPPRLHGGTVAGLLEIAATATLLIRLPRDEPLPAVKPVNVTVDYLRAGAPRDTYAAATINRLGRRIANLRVAAWQEDREAPIAVAHMNIMLARPAP
jgi:acyl-coenzyme A thioesterase PaaI-like protein